LYSTTVTQNFFLIAIRQGYEPPPAHHHPASW
jgi:hypothetical protein